jgi:NodT family efflux transporter outer membrane factor (OMF) lipoprotein
MIRVFWLFLSFFLLVSCSLAPTYYRPEMDIPTAYKEAGKWIPAHPSYAIEDRGPWWMVYDDSSLNMLEDQVTESNQELKAAYARYQEARAQVMIAKAGLYPQLNAVALPQRIGTSGNIANTLPVSIYNDTSLGASLSYEVDLWGRIRNLVAAAQSRERASAADLGAMYLSLHAELASDYFGLRGDEESQRILDKTVRVYKKALYLTRMRHNGGAAPASDVDQAETQLKSTQTLATDIRLRRALLEHAIAILVGQPPSSFVVPPAHRIKLVSIAPSVPAVILERRPDVAAAELRVEAANADIGVARAAYYPDISILGSIGFESQILSNLIEMPSLFWAIGPQATQVLFDGGRIQGFIDRARASYFENVADYRQTVLIAFRQVEDSLVSIRRLNEEMQTEAVAVLAANRAVAQANYRYLGGIITYLDVVVLQNTALQTELTDVDIRTRRQIASVDLIRAIGGGWE